MQLMRPCETLTDELLIDFRFHLTSPQGVTGNSHSYNKPLWKNPAWLDQVPVKLVFTSLVVVAVEGKKPYFKRITHNSFIQEIWKLGRTFQLTKIFYQFDQPGMCKFFN